MLKKIILNLDVEITSGGEDFIKFIENLSREGMFVRIRSIKTPPDFDCKTPLEFEIELVTGETLNLNCDVKWLCKVSPDYLSRETSTEILNQLSAVKLHNR